MTFPCAFSPHTLSLYSFLCFSYKLLLPVALFLQEKEFLAYYVFKLKTLITLILLVWVFILLAASFDNIWNSIEYVVNLYDIWQYLSKTFDIWVEQYLMIIWRYLTTKTSTLEPENYHPKDIVRYCHLLPSGNRA